MGRHRGLPLHRTAIARGCPVHPGCGSAGMGAFVGTIRMGRHRGLPLHRNAATSGSPRSIQAAGALGWAHSWGLSGWADTGVCPYTGTLPHRGLPGPSRLRERWDGRIRGDYPDGQAQGPAPTPERYHVGIAEVEPGYAPASGLPGYIQVTATRGDCVHIIRMGRHRGLPLRQKNSRR